MTGYCQSVRRGPLRPRPPARRPPARARAPGLVQAFLNTFWDLERGRGGGCGPRPTAYARLAGRARLRRRRPEPGADLDRAILELREALRAPGAGQPRRRRRAGAAGRAGPGRARRRRAGAACTRPGPAQPAPLEPAGDGPDAACALALGIVFAARADGTFARLKACPHAHCGWVFYDPSRNRSGQWCSMRICGNRTKAARYRALAVASGRGAARRRFLVALRADVGRRDAAPRTAGEAYRSRDAPGAHPSDGACRICPAARRFRPVTPNVHGRATPAPPSRDDVAPRAPGAASPDAAIRSPRPASDRATRHAPPAPRSDGDRARRSTADRRATVRGRGRAWLALRPARGPAPPLHAMSRANAAADGASAGFLSGRAGTPSARPVHSAGLARAPRAPLRRAPAPPAERADARGSKPRRRRAARPRAAPHPPGPPHHPRRAAPSHHARRVEQPAGQRVEGRPPATCARCPLRATAPRRRTCARCAGASGSARGAGCWPSPATAAPTTRPGSRWTELAEALVALGARTALNLDGGGSTSLVCAGRLRNVPREDHGSSCWRGGHDRSRP